MTYEDRPRPDQGACYVNARLDHVWLQIGQHHLLPGLKAVGKVARGQV